ncbi:hypothetical protein GOBAR_AA39420 [Gossypium barbadense]|uniref:Uncharacterized protein n=1 Tax=Gossypium barbadense TaxID=3634 RepID=A0A2P5VR24_GOSBA|nr:hypothetical protein GOBAR_AA39420 [Gossypium barbadense]
MALKNQQASIQGLETQISQLSKLISERPQGSLPSNTEPNPREQLNTINTQDDKGLVEPEPELRQETVVSKGRDEFIEALSQMPNAMKFLKVLLVNKRKLDEASHVELNAVSLHFVWETKRSPFKLVILASHRTLKKLSFKEVNEPCSKNDRGHIHEERRLRIQELDEWRVHKPRTHYKLKLRQNKPDTSPNQLKVGDKLLLDAANPHIVTTTSNEEIPLTILSIFPFGTVEHTRPGTRACLRPWPSRGRNTTMQYGRVEAGHDLPKTQDAINPHGRATWPWVNLIGEHRCGNGKTQACQGQGSILFLRHGRAFCHHQEARRPRSHPQRDLGTGFFLSRCIDWATIEQVQLANAISTLLTTDPWEWFFAITKPSYLEVTLELCSTFHLQVVMTNNDKPSTIHFRLDGLVRAMSVPEFGATLGLYTDEFMEEEDMNALPCNIHISLSLCWKALAPLSSTYDPSRSKASALTPSLRYLHTILAHTLTGRREAPASSSPTTPTIYDRAISEGSNLYRPLRDAPCQTLRPPQHRGPVINAYTDRSDVPIGHYDYVTHEDDRAPT